MWQLIHRPPDEDGSSSVAEPLVLDALIALIALHQRPGRLHGVLISVTPSSEEQMVDVRI